MQDAIKALYEVGVTNKVNNAGEVGSSVGSSISHWFTIKDEAFKGLEILFFALSLLPLCFSAIIEYINTPP